MKKPKPQDNAQLPLGGPIRNCGLFADHFLQHKLPERPKWQAADDLPEAFEAIRSLFEAAHSPPI